jgi:hypothetical protein
MHAVYATLVLLLQELLSSPNQSSLSHPQQHSLASRTASPSPAGARLQHPLSAASPVTTPACSAGHVAASGMGCSASGSSDKNFCGKALMVDVSTCTATPEGSLGGTPVTALQALTARRNKQQQSTLATDWQSHYQQKASRCPSPACCSTLAPAAQHAHSRCASPSSSLPENRVASSGNAPTAGSTWLPPPAGEHVQSSGGMQSTTQAAFCTIYCHVT